MDDFSDEWLRNIILDLCRHYFSRVDKEKACSKNKKYLVLTYTNRYLEDIGMSKLVNSEAIKVNYPVANQSFVPTYSYSNPILGKVLNYPKTLRSNEAIPDTCECHDSPFMDHRLGHAVTGDLKIVEDRKLRNLLSKGSNYRECYKFSKSDVITMLTKDLDNHIKKSSEKSHLP